MANAIQTFFDWAPSIVGVTFAVSVFIFSPLALFRRTRAIAGVEYIVASYIFGTVLWIFGAIFTFVYWGWIGFVAGLFLFGVGVVPMGFVGLALRHEWAELGDLGLILLLTLVTRFAGAAYLANAEKHGLV